MGIINNIEKVGKIVCYQYSSIDLGTDKYSDGINNDCLWGEPHWLFDGRTNTAFGKIFIPVCGWKLKNYKDPNK